MLAVAVRVVVNAPDVVKLPPRVIVFPVLATPVPPLTPNKIPLTVELVNDKVKPVPVLPDVIVPTVVKLGIEVMLFCVAAVTLAAVPVVF